jgi:hypothetical protein
MGKRARHIPATTASIARKNTSGEGWPLAKETSAGARAINRDPPADADTQVRVDMPGLRLTVRARLRRSEYRQAVARW